MPMLLASLGWAWSRRAQLLPAVLVLAGLLVLWQAYRTGHDIGEADALAHQRTDTDRRMTDAIRADDAARRCAADPACRVRPDQYRRD